MKKVPGLFTLSVTLLVLIAVEGKAQPALNRFCLNPNGETRVVVQPDSKILIGGDLQPRHASGNGERQTRFATVNVLIDASVSVAFSEIVPGFGQNVYAAATDPNGNTSKFSRCLVDAPPPALGNYPNPVRRWRSTTCSSGSRRFQRRRHARPRHGQRQHRHHVDLVAAMPASLLD